MLSSKEVCHPTHGKGLKVKSTLLSKLDFLCAMFDIARSGWEGFIDLCVPLPFGFVFSLQYITVATIDIQSQWHPTSNRTSCPEDLNLVLGWDTLNASCDGKFEIQNGCISST